MYSDCSTLEHWLASAACRTALPRPIATQKAFGCAALLVFLLAQATDGILTCIGVGAYGFHAEANPVAASLMATFGAGPAVAGLKLLTASLGVLLHALGVHRVLALIAGIYVVAAVLPWAAVLLAR